jgi:UDP-2,3-diacylglucosamine pyrophosphatase LpxH
MDFVINDLHIPYESADIVNAVLSLANSVQPERLYINGDLVDMWEISSHSKNTKSGTQLADEIRLANSYLDTMRNKLPNTEIVYIFGNHEHRFARFIADNAVELYGLSGLTLAEQLKLKERDIQLVYSGLRESYIRAYDDLVIGHFDRVNAHSAYTAKTLVDKYGASIIQGHTHRVGYHAKSTLADTFHGYENGCMCDLNPVYSLSPNWQHGFAVVHRHNNKSFVEQITITDGEFVFGGKHWKVGVDCE